MDGGCYAVHQQWTRRWGGTQYSNTKTVLYVDDGKSLEHHKSKV
jgi:hypothetical protein